MSFDNEAAGDLVFVPQAPSGRRLRAVDARELRGIRDRSRNRARHSWRPAIGTGPGVRFAAVVLAFSVTAIAAFFLGRRHAMRAARAAIRDLPVPLPVPDTPYEPISAVRIGDRRVVAFVDDDLVDDFAAFPPLPGPPPAARFATIAPAGIRSAADLVDRPVAMAAASIALLAAGLMLGLSEAVPLAVTAAVAMLGAAFVARLAVLLWGLEFGPDDLS